MARKSRKVDYVNVADMGVMAVSAEEKKKGYRAGLYARLSEETEANRERATIETQMELLRKFASDSEDIVVEREYFDISYTGTNFERPGFEEMIKDMRNGVINCIIVKDLSRLGRNYVETGNYIERVFPFFETRFIAVTDGYDSCRTGEELLMPLKNMVNEMYVKDLSKKEKAAFRTYWSRGEYPGGKIPYGYVKRERRLYVDDEAAETVREIFRLFLSGDSLREIVRKLNGKGIVNPSSYKLLQYGHEIPEGKNTEWNRVAVKAILSNYAYRGASVHNKTEMVNGKLLDVPADRWIIVEDTHEPLVSREDYEQAQEILGEFAAAHRDKCLEHGYDHAGQNLLGARVVCAECGRSMRFRVLGKKRNSRGYWCRTYMDSALGSCDNHSISADKVWESVFAVIREHMRVSVDVEETVRRLNARSENAAKHDLYAKTAEQIRKELGKAVKVKAGLFEDYRDGLIDSEQYVRASKDYTKKVNELSARLDEVLKTQAEYSRQFRVNEDWGAAVRAYLGKRKLTKGMAEAFVDKVLVHKNGDIEVRLRYEDTLEDLIRIKEERAV